MTREEALEKIKEAISECLDKNVEVTEADSFESLDIDSLEVTEIVVALEDNTGMDIQNMDCLSTETIGQLIDCMVS